MANLDGSIIMEMFGFLPHQALLQLMEEAIGMYNVGTEKDIQMFILAERCVKGVANPLRLAPKGP